MNIRFINLSELPHLLPLLEQLGYPDSLENFIKRCKKFLNIDGYGIAVARDVDQIIGFIAWSKSLLIVSDATRFHIEAIAVDPKFQKMSISKKLVQFLEDYVLNYSPAIIDLTSGLRRAKENVREFYRKLGYANEGYMAKLYLRKEIKDNS